MPRDRISTPLVLLRQIKMTSTGACVIYCPYNWDGEEVWYSLLDEEYKSTTISRQGKINIHQTKYRRNHPKSKLEGKWVVIGLAHYDELVVSQTQKPVNDTEPTIELLAASK